MDAKSIISLAKRLGASTAILAAVMDDLAGDGTSLKIDFRSLAEASGQAVQTVYTGVRLLEAAGMVAKTSGKKGNTYVLNSRLNNIEHTTTTSLKDVVCSNLQNLEHADDDYNPDTPFNILSDAFSHESGVPFHSPQKWNASVTSWVEAGATKEDVKAACDYIKNKRWKFIGPWTIDVPIMVEIGKRKGGKTEPENDGLWSYDDQPEWMKAGWKKPGDNGDHQEEEDKEYLF